MDQVFVMKTHKQLFPQIVSFENLLLAAQKAQKGKRFQDQVVRFNLRLETELLELQRSLKSQCYQPGPYHAFYITDPKPRMISAAPYRDRVVHHAVCNVIAPILENSLIFDTYANRKGKGTHKAILRYQHFARKYAYVLSCDIRKYFPSIDHEILKQLIRKKVACKSTLWLLDTIIDHSNEQEPHVPYFPGDDLFTPYVRRKGLPIGNLTSQLLGNYYLNPLDQYIKHGLRCKGYVRYVDDFVLLDNDKARLHAYRAKVDEFLNAYRLVLHPRKTQVSPTEKGMGFLGHKVFPYHRLLKGENIRRLNKRLKGMYTAYRKGTLSEEAFDLRLQSWCVHAAFSRTYSLQFRIFSDIEAKGISPDKAQRVARRLLEQQSNQLPFGKSQQQQPR